MGCCKSCSTDSVCEDAYKFALVQQAGKDLIVWGPVSVESVSSDDKLIRIGAIEAALPHFWKRGALTMLHKDALIVGKVEKLIEASELDEISKKAGPLVQSLVEEHGGLPTGVLTVTEAMVDAFPHLSSVKGTRQFFAAARVYNDGEEASRLAIEEIRKGELDSFSLAGMPIEAVETEQCSDGSCRTVLDVSKMTLSAITLGSRHGGEGPFSAVTRNNGAALITVTQAGDGSTKVSLENGDTIESTLQQSVALFHEGKLDGRGEKMPDESTEQTNDATEAVEQQDEEQVDVEALASAVQDLMRRVEALEGDKPEAEDDEEPAEEATEQSKAITSEDVSKAVSQAVEQAVKPLQKELASLKANRSVEQADTPDPASTADPSKERNAILEQAARSGDPYAVKEALRQVRGTA